MSSPVEEIKQRLSVADVVGSYIKLHKAGGNFKAVCPFHSEKAPSFYVSPAREIWHCFGCNRGGDIFEFVKQIEGVEFPEALRILADRAGVTIKYERPEFHDGKTRLLDLLKSAAVFYQKELVNNKEVLNYLWKRGLKNETLKKFSVGFSPEEEKGWRHLLSHLKARGFSSDEIEKAGLAIKTANGDYYDRFRGRIMFPLKDGSGRVVGFSGRIFALPSVALAKEGEEKAKYINTPQTILYDKSKILYGFDLAKMEIRKKDACVLVEGQMDVLMSHQAGVSNAVAVSGTALTESHLIAIGRLTNNLIMAFDSDEAGLSAAKRSIDMALQADFEVKAVQVTTGKDPADVVLESPETWEKSVNSARHIIDFYLSVIKAKNKETREFKKEVEKNVLPYVALINSEIDKSHWAGLIANEIGAKEQVVLDQLRKIKLQNQGVPFPKENKASVPVKTRRELLEERLAGIAIWKNNNDLVPESALEILKIKDKEYLNKLSLEAELYLTGNENIEAEAASLSKELKKEIIKEKLEKITEEIRKIEVKGDKESIGVKLEEFRKLSKELTEV